jgi:hypothetical protein
MPTKAPTLTEVFQRLRAAFEEGSHRHPGLDHFWVLSVAFVGDKVLEAIARGFGKPLAEVTKWPDRDDLVEYSCFVGGTDPFVRFRELAWDARTAFVQLLRGAGQAAQHTAYDALPHVSWMADLYAMASVSDAPRLRVRRLLVGEYPVAVGPQRLVFVPDDEQNAARMQQTRERYGKPMAVHLFQRLELDTFTASAGMLDVIVHDASENPPFQEALAAALATPTMGESTEVDNSVKEQPGGGQGASRTAQDRQTAVSPPTWVNSAELIGPCGHKAFAELLGISPKHLYQEIQEERIWRRPGPTKYRFYFYHRAPDIHRRLQEALERSRSRRS